MLQELIDLMNEFSEKYNFSEEDINKIQRAVFNCENGDPELTVTDEIVDFVVPEEED